MESVAPGDKDQRLYYTLQPLYQKQSIQIMAPVDAPRVFARPIMSRHQAQTLIEGIPQVNAAPFCARAPRDLTEHYESLLRTYQPEALLQITMSIYQKRQQLQRQKRRLGSVDEAYFRKAEELLHCELAAALELSPEEIPAYIASVVEQL